MSRSYTAPTGKVYTGAGVAEKIAADLANHPGETWSIPPDLLGAVRAHLRKRLKHPPPRTPRHVAERWQRHVEHLHNQDARLPRLVDGVWTTEGAVEIGGVTVPAKVTIPDHPPTWRPFPCFPDPSVFTDVTLPPRPATDYARAFAEYNPPPRSGAEIAVTMDADEARKVAEHVLAHGQRTIFAALHPRGYLYALGDTEADARENALSRRDINRDEARSVSVDFPPPETDAAWADELIFVTVSGTTESLRVYVASVDDVIPWCPADLWDSGDVAP